MKQNILTIQESTIILLGYVGDESSTLIRIPVSTFIYRYGVGGTFELIHRPPGELYGHPISNISVVNGFVEWVVGSEELATHGYGEAQLTYVRGNGVAHTKIWQTVIMRSLADTSEIPAPWTPWVHMLYEYKTDAEDAATRAEEASAHYPYIDSTTNNWIMWDMSINDWVDTGISAFSVSRYEELPDKPAINGVELNGNMDLSDIEAVYEDTTAGWNARADFIPRSGAVVIYTDNSIVDGEYVPGIKIGDGLAYLVDLPFVSDDIRKMIIDHSADTTAHISSSERSKWNDKVTCFVEAIEDNDYVLRFSNN